MSVEIQLRDREWSFPKREPCNGDQDHIIGSRDSHNETPSRDTLFVSIFKELELHCLPC